ncbi:hypothetical protein SP15_017 [Bacillus phage SP-15]|uniref:Uncharacterized protein n=1 Tax=Bacillus phage SP-15 TaxID=1792032 RepID=A0A127AVX0_9CAUD|nr:hypothetical protein SP15_017 [Bacillus phage SP-15]AMM44816.1 hypothetical protein SP15_017 [Bacillus phage SP-15]
MCDNSKETLPISLGIVVEMIKTDHLVVKDGGRIKFLKNNEIRHYDQAEKSFPR